MVLPDTDGCGKADHRPHRLLEGRSGRALIVALALIAFAANSILCRLALREAQIDPATFSTIRVVAGAATLILIASRRRRSRLRESGSWASAVALALYAVPFAFAYVDLTAGTGALLLFGSVQLTMLGWAVWSGERASAGEWFGIMLASGGLVYLVLPGLAAPRTGAAVQMITAGIAWGVYSLRGRRVSDPIAATAGNFTRAVPLVAAVSIAMLGRASAGTTGVLLAVVSGSIASGLGYVVWYAALARLTAMRAALVQLATPVITAAGGVILLGEVVSGRLLLAGGVVLGGIAMAIVTRERAARA